MSETTGTVNFVVGNETFQTWYKTLGSLASPKMGTRPLVLLHGGPGIPHHGLLGHDTLYKQYGIPVVWYDQLGCGSSTHLREKPKEFWTPELFMDELENLVQKLGISDNFDVLGHSWGGMLAAQWAATRHPKGLKRIVVTNSPASMALWEEAAKRLLWKETQSVQDEIFKGQREGVYDSPEYEAAMREFYKHVVCRCDPWPEAVTVSHAELAKDPTVYTTMCGPDEFVIVGTMRHWDITGIVQNITQPTLIINGRYDMAQDSAIAPFVEKIPKVKWVKFEESSHMPYWEEPELYYEVVGKFLTD